MVALVAGKAGRVGDHDQIPRQEEPEDLPPPVPQNALMAGPSREQDGRGLHPAFEPEFGLGGQMARRRTQIPQDVGFLGRQPGQPREPYGCGIVRLGRR